MLPAKDLSAGIAKNLAQTVPKRGQKITTPSGCWREEEETDRCLDQQKSLLEAQRIEKKCLRSVAEWLEDKGLARVTTKKGKYWCNFGHERDRNLWIYPEEALYLVEINVLELQYGGVTLSVQSAFQLILSSHVSLQTYRVYCKLQRLGWIIFRHQRPVGWGSTPSKEVPPPKTPTRPTPLDEVEVIDLDDDEHFKAFDLYVPNIQDKKQVLLRVAPHHLLPPNSVPLRKEYLLKFGGGPPALLQDPPQLPPQPELRFHNQGPSWPFPNQFQRHNHFQNQFYIRMQQTNYRQNSYQRFEFQYYGHPGAFQQNNFNYGHHRPRQFHPPRGGRGNPRWRQLGPGNSQLRDQIPSYEIDKQKRVNGQSAPRKITSKCWAELKVKEGAIETITLEPEVEVESDRVSSDCSGLVLPTDCKSYRSVLKKLEIFKEGIAERDPNPPKLVIKYDVYQPSSNFKKSLRPQPNYQVIILKHTDEFPSESQIEMIDSVRVGGTLLFALVQPDSIQFLSIDKVELKLTL